MSTTEKTKPAEFATATGGPLATTRPVDAEQRQMGSTGASMLFDNAMFNRLLEIANMMASAKRLPKHCHGSPADCFIIASMAYRWGMDPFQVALKTYVVSESRGGPPRDGAPVAYEAQLVSAVINTLAPLESRLKTTTTGTGEDMECTVVGKLRDSDTPDAKTVKLKDVKIRNSPLWQSDPDQQLAYFTQRAWARKYCSEILLGVYAPEDDWAESTAMVDVSPPRPQTPTEALDKFANTGGAGGTASAGDVKAEQVKPAADKPKDPPPAPAVKEHVVEGTGEVLSVPVPPAEVSEGWTKAKKWLPLYKWLAMVLPNVGDLPTRKVLAEEWKDVLDAARAHSDGYKSSVERLMAAALKEAPGGEPS